MFKADTSHIYLIFHVKYSINELILKKSEIEVEEIKRTEQRNIEE